MKKLTLAGKLILWDIICMVIVTAMLNVIFLYTLPKTGFGKKIIEQQMHVINNEIWKKQRDEAEAARKAAIEEFDKSLREKIKQAEKSNTSFNI